MFPDLSFVEIGRGLEVEAVEGGRSLNEFSLEPSDPTNTEEEPLFGNAVDDIEETEERLIVRDQYLEYAQAAFRQRGRTYPFSRSDSSVALRVTPGLEKLAARVADLSSKVSVGHATAKEFEVSGFKALQSLIGGWGVCLGSPRYDKTGPERAVRLFRSHLHPWEKGPHIQESFPKSGDLGVDGFLVLGRSWGGPLVIYQAKNASFDFRSPPEEFARPSQVLFSWFGRRLNESRALLQVLALNTVLTIDYKEKIYRERGAGAGFHILDATDILAVEFLSEIDHRDWSGVHIT
jgi:hypothetical protein